MRKIHILKQSGHSGFTFTMNQAHHDFEFITAPINRVLQLVSDSHLFIFCTYIYLPKRVCRIVDTYSNYNKVRDMTQIFMYVINVKKIIGYLFLLVILNLQIKISVLPKKAWKFFLNYDLTQKLELPKSLKCTKSSNLTKSST